METKEMSFSEALGITEERFHMIAKSCAEVTAEKVMQMLSGKGDEMAKSDFLIELEKLIPKDATRLELMFAGYMIMSTMNSISDDKGNPEFVQGLMQTLTS